MPLRHLTLARKRAAMTLMLEHPEETPYHAKTSRTPDRTRCLMADVRVSRKCPTNSATCGTPGKLDGEFGDLGVMVWPVGVAPWDQYGRCCRATF